MAGGSLSLMRDDSLAALALKPILPGWLFNEDGTVSLPVSREYPRRHLP